MVFQRLLKNDGRCGGENLHECVNKYSYEVPLNARCQASAVQCDPNEK